jgi:prolyl-tRNA editing enzyme YbaK/EbsC (Cys-tRNA(Pro) deacylase)
MNAEATLKGKNISYRLIKLADKAVSVEDVMRHVQEKMDVDEICKTMVVTDGDKNYALMLKGKSRVDISKASAAIGTKVRLVPFNQVKDAVGLEPGCVCPLLLSIPLYVDSRVFDTEKINFGSGDLLYGIEIASKDLAKAVSYTKADLAE